MIYFYDTCSLLSKLDEAFADKFYISTVTLKELENIKTSAAKDADIKYKARKLIHLLTEHQDKYTAVPFEWEEEIKGYNLLPDNNDSKIIFTAYYKWLREEPNLAFVTEDLCCYHIARNINSSFPVIYHKEDYKDEYTGFTVMELADSEAEARFYDKYLDWEKLDNINEYLLIKNNSNEIIDTYKYTEDGYKTLQYPIFNSRMFGTIKPKDKYQQIAMDSLKTNKITMIRGAAGSGKTLLSFAYLFEQLEKHEIEKIIVFCNTVATQNSAKLGFYPGTRDEKLLDSQIGNLLISKLGDRIAVEKMIEEGTLVLLPMSDIRGYDTSGMKAGIYISEAQNLDIELIRLALTRVGEDSICILDGDSDAQVDLPSYAGINNGMRRVSQVFRGDSCYGEVTLQKIYRSKIAELAQKL